MTQRLTGPILTFVIDKAESEAEHNPYGFERIHIWALNYDGRGTALLTYNDETEFNMLGPEDLHYIFCGSDRGTRWYRREA